MSLRPISNTAPSMKLSLTSLLHVSYCFSFETLLTLRGSLTAHFSASTGSVIGILDFSLFFREVYWQTLLPNSSCFLFSFYAFFFSFWCGSSSKSLLNLLQYRFSFLCLDILAARHIDLSSLPGDWTSTPCIKRSSLNHWTARQVLPQAILRKVFYSWPRPSSSPQRYSGSLCHPLSL